MRFVSKSHNYRTCLLNDSVPAAGYLSCNDYAYWVKCADWDVDSHQWRMSYGGRCVSDVQYRPWRENGRTVELTTTVDSGSGENWRQLLDKSRDHATDLRVLVEASDRRLQLGAKLLRALGSRQKCIETLAREQAEQHELTEHRFAQMQHAMQQAIDELQTTRQSMRQEVDHAIERIDRGLTELDRIDQFERRLDQLGRLDEFERRLWALDKLEDFERKLKTLDRLDEFERRLGAIDQFEVKLKRIDEVEQRLGELNRLDEFEQRLAALDRLDEFQQRIDRLEQAVADHRQQTDDRIDEHQQTTASELSRLESFEQRMTALNRLDGFEEQLRALGRLDEFEQRLGELRRLDEFEKRLGELGRLDEFAERLKSLDRLDEFEQRLAELHRLDEFNQRLSALDRLDEFDRRLAALDRLDEFEQRLSALSRLDEFERRLESLGRVDQLSVRLAQVEQCVLGDHRELLALREEMREKDMNKPPVDESVVRSPKRNHSKESAGRADATFGDSWPVPLAPLLEKLRDEAA